MIDKRNAKAWTSIGYAYKEMGEIDAAIGAYGNAYVLSPEDKGSSFDLGMAYYSKNEFARAIPYFEKIRAAGADSKNSILVDILNYHRGALTMLAECYKALGDTANFERINNEINKHYPRQGSTSPMSIFYEKTEKE
ncbi:tetratricopeptide repeat protein [Patescibacteria group bacterium]|nr:tetratricopeptide repeat protein [Patescibacteria group bacterium]